MFKNSFDIERIEPRLRGIAKSLIGRVKGQVITSLAENGILDKGGATPPATLESIQVLLSLAEEGVGCLLEDKNSDAPFGFPLEEIDKIVTSYVKPDAIPEALIDEENGNIVVMWPDDESLLYILTAPVDIEERMKTREIFDYPIKIHYGKAGFKLIQS